MNANTNKASFYHVIASDEFLIKEKKSEHLQ